MRKSWNIRMMATAGLAVSGAMVGGATGQVVEPVVDLGLLPGDAVGVIATNTQHEGMVSLGDGVYLAVWTDFRARSSGSQSVQSDADVFGIRLNAEGQPLDAAPFVIGGGMGMQQRPRVAWNGSAWLVVYVSQDPTEFYFEDRLRAVRVSAAGEVLDAEPLVFPADQFEPSLLGLGLSGNGGEWLATRFIYHADGYGTYLAGQRIDGQGQLVDVEPVMLLDWVYGSATVLPGDGEYLVAAGDWTTSSETKAVRVDLDLQRVGSEFALPSRNLASNGSSYYTVWIRDFVNLVGSPVTSAGVLTNPNGQLLVPNVQGDLNLAFDGANWWLRWGYDSNQRLMRIDEAGSVVDAGGVLLPLSVTGSVTSLYSTQLTARPGGGVLFSWTDYRGSLGSDSNVFALPVTGGNVAGAEAAVSISSRNQRSASMAGGPGGSRAVAYVSEGAGGDRVLLQRLGADGAAVGEPVEVYAGANIGRVGLAWNGQVYLAAFDVGPIGLTTLQIKARRVGADGTMVDSAAFDVMPGFNAAVGALGQDFLVAGVRYGFYPQNIYLYGSRVDGATGTPTDGPNGLYLGGFYVNSVPRVRDDGEQWVVLAHSHWTHNSSQSDPLLARVPLAGAPAAAYNPAHVSGGAGDPDFAWSGQVGLCVYRMNTLANANNFVMGRLMQADGSFFGTPFVVAEAAGRQLRPTTVWTGEEFFVVWEDQREQESFYDARTDVYGVRVSEAGELLDGGAFVVVDREGAECGPSLIAGGGAVLAATSRFVCDGQFSSYRVGVTRVGELGCAADLTGDGVADSGDLAEFVSAFVVGDVGVADLTGDGVVDSGDLAEFVALFVAGC